MKNFTQGQRPKKPENIRSQIFVPKISERANNTIQKYFVFKHTYRQLPLSLKIWFEFWWWEDQNIRKLPNQSPSPRALPSVIANTMLRNRRNTAHCCWWKMIKLKYKLWFPPPAPSPGPCTTLRSRCRMIVSVLKYNQVGEKSYGQQFHFVRGTIYINEMISISERKLICKCGEGWGEGRRADGRAEAGRAAVAWFWWVLEFFNFDIDLHRIDKHSIWTITHGVSHSLQLNHLSAKIFTDSQLYWSLLTKLTVEWCDRSLVNIALMSQLENSSEQRMSHPVSVFTEALRLVWRVSNNIGSNWDQQSFW